MVKRYLLQDMGSDKYVSYIDFISSNELNVTYESSIYYAKQFTGEEIGIIMDMNLPHNEEHRTFKIIDILIQGV